MAAAPAAAVAQTAGAAQYGGVLPTTVTPSGDVVPTPEASAPAPVTTAEASPASTESPAITPSSASTESSASPSSLPYTGRDLVVLLFAGFALVALGYGLRTMTRAAPAVS